MNISGENLLAVYGSLRTGFGIPSLPIELRAALVDRGPCVIPGLLYDLGDFPGMIEGDGRVMGELVQILGRDALARLDRYEGFDEARPEESLFIRRSLRLLEPAIDVWVYLFNGEIDERRRVASGDWAVHMAARRSVIRRGCGE